MLRLFLFILLNGFFSACFADDYERQIIQQRIAPIGQVRVEKSAADAAQKEPPSSKQKPATPQQAGEKTYKQYCFVCHQNGLAGAPKFRDSASWKLRLAKMTVAQLTASALKGKNAMPAKGTCSECTKQDIRLAIEYMLPKK